MERYARQTILPNFGEKTQRKLQSSKVLVIGVGGLGIPVLQYLTAAGIGTLGIADGDKIELSNLQRQVLFYEDEIGRNKTDVAFEKLSRLNSTVSFQIFPQFIDKSNVFQCIEPFDVIVDCTDNFGVRYLVNDVCSLLKKTLVFASIFQFEAQISVFHYGDSPYNLRDIFPDIPDEKSIPNCSEAGVMGVLPGIAGCYQANEVIKILTENGTVNSGKLLVYSSLTNEVTQIKLLQNPQKFLPKSKQDILNQTYQITCSPFLSIERLEELKQVLTEEKSVLIDVRETHEFPKVPDLVHLDMPLSGLEQTLTDLSNYDHLIFICRSGNRSKKAIEVVSRQFPEKKYYNVSKGMMIFNL